MYSDKELLQALKDCKSKHGFVKTTILNNDDDFPSAATFYTRFGSLDEALTRAGISDTTSSKSGRPSGKKYSDDELLQYLEKCYNTYGLVNSTNLREDDSFPEPSIYWIRFDNLEKACDRAGVEYKYREDSYTDEEYFEELRRIKEEYGDTKTETIRKADGPTVQSYQKRFGTIVEARKEAGLERVNYDKKFTKGELISKLQDSFDKQPTSTEINNCDNLPNANTFTNYFGSLKRAYKQAGIYEWSEGERVDEESGDAFIYVIKLHRKTTDETYYYIGKSTYSLKERLISHKSDFSQSAPKQSKNGDILSSSHNEYEYLGLVEREEYSMGEDENETQFTRRLREKERQKANEIVLEKETTNVIGGK